MEENKIKNEILHELGIGNGGMTLREWRKLLHWMELEHAKSALKTNTLTKTVWGAIALAITGIILHKLGLVT